MGMLADFVLETANAPGTGTINLAGAATDRRSFASAFSGGGSVFYFIDDGAQAEWGTGTLTIGSPNTLSRDTVLGNTAGTTSRLNFAGAVRVFNEIPSGRAVVVDNSGVAVLPDGSPVGPPVGSGLDYWGATAPAGYLFSYGQAVSRTTYAKLFAVLGVLYGAGDGSTTFNLPDKRGRASIAKDDMGGASAGRVTAGVSGVDGTTLGSAGGDQALQQHFHTVTDPGHTHGITDAGHHHQVTYTTGAATPGGAAYLSATGSLSDTSTATTGITGTDSATTGITGTANAGAGNAQNLPPGIVCNYIIFAGA